MVCEGGSACFTLTAEISEISRLDQWFSGFGAEHRLSQELLEELRVCLHEVIGNVILHGGNLGVPHTISVTAWTDQANIALSVEDNAMPFNPLALPIEPIATSLEEAKVGGLGLHLVRSFTDRLDYDQPSGHNRLTLVRKLCRS